MNRETLCHELRELLNQWQVLQTSTTATQQDFIVMERKIDVIVRQMDALQKVA